MCILRSLAFCSFSDVSCLSCCCLVHRSDRFTQMLAAAVLGYYWVEHKTQGEAASGRKAVKQRMGGEAQKVWRGSRRRLNKVVQQHGRPVEPGRWLHRPPNVASPRTPVSMTCPSTVMSANRPPGALSGRCQSTSITAASTKVPRAVGGLPGSVLALSVAFTLFYKTVSKHSMNDRLSRLMKELEL
jgi:hypothetical protein